MSVFAKYRPTAYPHTFAVEITVSRIAGGIPTDPKVAEGWLKTKLVADRDDLIREAVAEVMAERGVTADEAAKVVDITKHLNGFKRDTTGLYFEGRQVKACIKEAANIRWPQGRWSADKNGKVRLAIKTGDERTSGKATRSFWAEHAFVQDDRIPLGVAEPTGVAQRFVHTWRGSGIQYEEFIDDAKLAFTVASDLDFADEHWALLWLTAEQNGLGASRSQGYGRFEVTRWERIK